MTRLDGKVKSCLQLVRVARMLSVARPRQDRSRRVREPKPEREPFADGPRNTPHTRCPRESTTPDLVGPVRRPREAFNRAELDLALTLHAPDAVLDTSRMSLEALKGHAAIRQGGLTRSTPTMRSTCRRSGRASVKIHRNNSRSHIHSLMRPLQAPGVPRA
jgi:hypothetical protein